MGEINTKDFIKSILDAHEMSLSFLCITREYENKDKVVYALSQELTNIQNCCLCNGIEITEWFDDVLHYPGDRDENDGILYDATYRGKQIKVGIDDYGQQYWLKYKDYEITGGSYNELSSCMYELNHIIDFEMYENSKTR